MDIEDLRNAVIDYYGTAWAAGNLVALDYVEKAKKASAQTIINMAIEAGIISARDVDYGDDRDDR